jgi:hypothetical protein
MTLRDGARIARGLRGPCDVGHTTVSSHAGQREREQRRDQGHGTGSPRVAPVALIPIGASCYQVR